MGEEQDRVTARHLPRDAAHPPQRKLPRRGLTAFPPQLPTIPSEKLETHLKGKGRKTGEKHVNKPQAPAAGLIE